MQIRKKNKRLARIRRMARTISGEGADHSPIADRLVDSLMRLADAMFDAHREPQRCGETHE